MLLVIHNMEIILFKIILSICRKNSFISILPGMARYTRTGGVLLLAPYQPGFLVKMQVIFPNHSGTNLVDRMRQSL